MATGGTGEESFLESYDLNEDSSDEDSSDEENELLEGIRNLSLSEIRFLQTLASEVKEKHISLLQKLENHPRCYISVFYHVTDATVKENIIKDGKLKASVSGQPTRRTASPIDKMKIGAVHFRLNLEKKNDKLPTTSPFGTERVCIPISNFSEYELFFNHYNRGNPTTNGGNRIYYVSLVLVKCSHIKYYDIKKALKKLDPQNNDFVYFDHEKEIYYYRNYYTLYDLQHGERRRRSFYVYYEIAVIGDVPLDENAKWDKVKKK